MPNLHEPLRIVRPEDLLVLDFTLINLRLSGDGRHLERVDNASPAQIIVQFPFQHIAERAFFESEATSEPAGPPPVSAIASGPSRLVFGLPDDQVTVDFSYDGLLNWEKLVPQLAPNALPRGASEGPGPAVPGDDRTAIEFPYRLLLSPDDSGRWVHRRAPFTNGSRTELWHTRLVSGDRPTHVRAIGRRVVPDVIRTSLSDRDLRDIVTLSSDFSVRPKSAADMGIPVFQWIIQLQIAKLWGFDYVPEPLEAEQLLLTALGASARLRGKWDYPRPDQDPELLASFGMPTPSLEKYEHIAGLGRDQFVSVIRRGFVHCGMRASIVKITERRFEPQQLGTEETAVGTVGIFGATAYLRQYYQIRIMEPEINYADLAGSYEHGGREMLLRSIRLTTLETPKIDLPGDKSPEDFELEALEAYIDAHPANPWNPFNPFQLIDDVAIARDAQQRLEKSFLEPFWIQVDKKDFDFGFVGKDWEGETVVGSMPLLFIPYEFVSETDQVVAAFALGTSIDPARSRRPLRNQILALADPHGSAPGSTKMPTESLTFMLEVVPESRIARLPSTYRPRWVMGVNGAEVHVESVERLTNTNKPIDMTFDPEYLANGLDTASNPAGIFAQIAPLRVEFAGERGGGIARPDAPVDRVSSRQGAMSSTFSKAVVSQADLSLLFGSGPTGAKVFGSVELKDILAEIGSVTPDHFGYADLPEETIAQILNDPAQHLEIPVLRTRPLERDGSPYAVETRFVWKPKLGASGAAANLFVFRENDSQFVLDARTVTPIDGSEARSEVRGELRRFGMNFVEVVQINMDRLAFVSLPGRKPDITAEGLGIAFLGPLEFINTLKDILPADGFSDPPAVEVSPAGIRAGYSLGIPSFGVGIFALQNLTLSATLSVPFTDRPAGFRFAISERHHPFIVTVTLFGGGGYFALGASANGIDEIEAAIEFGGNLSLNLGVASGGVYVMAGIYFGRTGDVATLTGYLRCGGYLSVLGLISISVEFYLAFTYRDKGDGRSEVWGQASVKVCVEIACFSKTVSLTVERRFAGASGDPTLDQVVNPEEWEVYCLAFAAEDVA